MKLLGKSSTPRILFALGFASLMGFASTSAFASSATDLTTALADLYPAPHTPSVAAATSAELEAAIQLIASPSSVTVTGPGTGGTSHAGLAQAANATVDSQYVITANTANLASQLIAPLLTGLNAGLTANGTPQSTLDTSDTSVISSAVSKDPTHLAITLTGALTVYDNSGVAQAKLIQTEASAGNLSKDTTNGPAGSTTLATIGADVSATDSSEITAGTFLAAFVEDESTASEPFIEGFTKGETPTALGRTANMIVSQAVTPLSATQVYDAFVGLVTSGSTQQANGAAGTTAVLPGITSNLLSGLATDALRNTTTEALITTAYASYASTIAAAAVTTVSSTDLGLLAKDIVSLATVGSTNAAAVTSAMVNAFPLTTVGSSMDPNLGNQVAVIQGAVHQYSTATIVEAIVNQAATHGVLATDTNLSDITNYANNLITALANGPTGTLNGLSVSDTVRSELAIGLSQAYLASSTTGAAGVVPSIVASAGAQDIVSQSDLDSVVGPVLTYMLMNYSTTYPNLVGQIAAAVSSDSAIIGQSYGSGNSAGTYTPANVAAKLISGASSNVALIDAIAVGVATSSSVTGNALYNGSADQFVTALFGLVKGTATDYYNVAVTLAQTTGYSAPGIAGDVATADPAIAAKVSGSIAALNSTTQGEAAAIAYAAAFNTTGATTSAADSIREAIATTVLLDLPSVDTAASALSISGSVALTVSDADKAVLAEDVAKDSLSNVAAVALAVAQAVPTTSSVTVLEAIADDAAKALTSADPNQAADIENVVNTVATGYNGSTANAYNSANPVDALSAANLGLFGAALAKDYTSLAGPVIVSNAINAAVTRYGSTIPSWIGSFAASVYATSPAYATQVADYVAANDTSIATDAGAITTAILTGLTTHGAADAVTIAQGIGSSISGLTEAEAVAIANAAAVITGVTATNENLIATDLVNDVSGLGPVQQQAALDAIAPTVSTALASSVANQKALAIALSGSFSSLNQVSIAYDVAKEDTASSANMAMIISGVAKDSTNISTIGSSTAAADTFVGGVVTDFGSNLGYTAVASLAQSLVSDLSSIAGIGNALSGFLTSQEIGTLTSNQVTAGDVVNVATTFAADIPAAAVAISGSAAAADTNFASDDASLTTNIINAAGSNSKTDAPLVAQALALNANGGLTASEAETIAETAVLTPGISDTQENSIATNVIGALSNPTLQTTALEVIANSFSANSINDTLSDQEALAKALAVTFNQLDQSAIAYSIANVSSINSSNADIALIAADVLKPASTAPSQSTVDTVIGNLITRFSSSNTNYTQAAGIAASLITDLGSTFAPMLNQTLINQEIAAGSAPVLAAESSVAAFTAALPADAIAIAGDATTSSVFTGANVLNVDESGSIGAVIAASLPGTASSNATTSGSVAVVVTLNALGANPAPTDVNYALGEVAGVFAANTSVPTTDYYQIATDLATQAVGQSMEIHDDSIPAIVAAFASNASFDTASSNGLVALLKTLVAANPWSAADLLGVAILGTTDAGVNGTLTASVLATDVLNDVTTPDLTALGLTKTALQSILTGVSTSALSVLENEYADITGQETTVVDE